MTKDQVTIQAFEMCRKYGFIEAQRLVKEARDASSEGTMSFALHNAVYKQICEFAKAGTMYRPCI